MRHAIPLLVTAFWTVGADAQDRLWYTDRSTGSKLESEVGLRIGQQGMSVAGELTLANRAGDTDVLPRLSSEWSLLDGLDVNASVRYADWNETPGAAAVDTDVRLRPPAAFVERIRAAAHGTGSADSSRSLEILFAPVETSLRLLGGAPLALETDMALAAGAAETLSSRVESTWGIGRSIDVGTTVSLRSGPAAAGSAAWNTALLYRSPLPGIERLEGSIAGLADGASEHGLAIRFPGLENGSATGTPFTLTSRAILSATSALGRDAQQRFGIETQLGGLAPRLLGGHNALSLTLERDLELDAPRRASLSYDHSWQPHEHGSIGLSLEVLDALDETEPALDLSWQTRF